MAAAAARQWLTPRRRPKRLPRCEYRKRGYLVPEAAATQGVLTRRDFKAVVASTLTLAQGLGIATTSSSGEDRLVGFPYSVVGAPRDVASNTRSHLGETKTTIDVARTEDIFTYSYNANGTVASYSISDIANLMAARRRYLE